MAFIEKLEEYLKKEGYLPEMTEFGLQFKSENLDFLSFRDDQDELFLNLFFPPNVSPVRNSTTSPSAMT